jgi:transposase
METGTYIGIDVAKAQLDVAVRPSGEQWVSATDSASLEELVGRLQALQPELIVLEATGGREGPAVAALAAAGLPVAVVNPRQVRDFARAVGQLAKTDVLDAQVLAHFAQVIHPMPRPLPDAQAQELAALLARRRQLIGDAHRGAPAPRHRSAGRADPYSAPPGLAGSGADRLGPYPLGAGPGQPRLAGAGESAAQCPRHRAHHRTYLAGGAARTGSAGS